MLPHVSTLDEEQLKLIQIRERTLVKVFRKEDACGAPFLTVFTICLLLNVGGSRRGSMLGLLSEVRSGVITGRFLAAY